MSCVYGALSRAVTATFVAAGATTAGNPVMLILGTGGKPTPIEHCEVVVLLCASVTRTRNASPPNAVGVPETEPSPEPCNPSGRKPKKSNWYGATPPAAFNCAE